MKKGKPTWKPAKMLDVREKKPGYRYRWVDRDPQNVEKKLAEGWVFVNDETGLSGEHIHPDKVGDGRPLDGAKTYRDSVLMALPEELGQARDAWVKEQTEKQTRGLANILRRDVESGARKTGAPVAELHGKIVID